MFFVVSIGGTYIDLKPNWIEKPVLNTYTKVFFSPNEEAIADFQLPSDPFYFLSDCTGCYLAYVVKMFGKWEGFSIISVYSSDLIHETIIIKIFSDNRQEAQRYCESQNTIIISDDDDTDVDAVVDQAKK